MSEAHVRVAGNTLGWDGYAVSWQTKEIKRSLYIVSPDSSGALYSSKPSSMCGFLSGKRTYCISEDTSAIASLVCTVRDCVVGLTRVLVGDNPSLASAAGWLSFWGAVGLIAGPAQLIIEFGVMAGIDAVSTRLMQEGEFASMSSLYPLSAAVAGIAIGTFAWFPSALSISLIVKVTCILLERFGVNLSQPQDVAELIKSPGLGGVLIGAYACIGAPLFEEYVCRSMLRDYFSLSESKKENGFWDKFKQRIKAPFTTQSKTGFTWERTKTVLKTSIIFGLAHASARQGWSNIPIIVSCTLSGIVFGLLRELTGNLWASTTLHGVWNLIAVLRCREIIPPIPGCE